MRKAMIPEVAHTKFFLNRDHMHLRFLRLKPDVIVYHAKAYAAPHIAEALQAVAVPSFQITVLDSASTDPVMDPTVWVRDSRFVDTLYVAGNMAWGPFERAGVYEVMAGKAGYLTWKREGIRVTLRNRGARHGSGEDRLGRCSDRAFG